MRLSLGVAMTLVTLFPSLACAQTDAAAASPSVGRYSAPPPSSTPIDIRRQSRRHPLLRLPIRMFRRVDGILCAKRTPRK
jgi:hypothetical protein